MTFTGCYDKIIRLFLLQYELHGFYVVSGKSPVPLGIEVSKSQFLGQAVMYPGDSVCDFSRHEFNTAAGRFVVEENAVAAEHAIALAVVDRSMVGIYFCHRIGTSGMEGVFSL